MTNHVSVLNEAVGAEIGNKARSALRVAGYVIFKGDPDYELRILRSALQEIARLAPEERVIPLDRAFAAVREMASIARNALGHTHS